MGDSLWFNLFLTGSGLAVYALLLASVVVSPLSSVFGLAVQAP